MKWKEKWFPNNVMSDSVMQISISVMLKRYFGGNTSIYYKNARQKNITHRGPGFQPVKNTVLYSTLSFISIVLQFCELQ